jgi:hypothetical protein
MKKLSNIYRFGNVFSWNEYKYRFVGSNNSWVWLVMINGDGMVDANAKKFFKDAKIIGITPATLVELARGKDSIRFETGCSYVGHNRFKINLKVSFGNLTNVFKKEGRETVEEFCLRVARHCGYLKKPRKKLNK